MIAMKTFMTAEVQYMIASKQLSMILRLVIYFSLFFTDMVLSSTFPFIVCVAQALIILMVCQGIKLINITAQKSDNHIPRLLKRAGEPDQNIFTCNLM